MFALHGTMKSLPTAAAAPGGFGPPRPVVEQARPVDLERGRALYAEACIACHGEAGDGGHGGGPTLLGGLELESIRAVAADGRNSMPAFGRVYSNADLNDVASYVLEVLARE
jgi:mono/diheme cytochrome c family protein